MQNLLVVLTTLLFAASQGRAADAQPSDGGSASPIATLSGTASQFKKAALFVLASEEELQAVWSKHVGAAESEAGTSNLCVDFKQCTVVGAFFGPCVNVHGIAVIEVRNSTDATVVRVVRESHQSAGGSETTTTPFAFIVLPNSQQKVVVEEGVQDYLGEPLQWRTYDPK